MDTHLGKAMQAMREGDFPRAIKHFDKLGKHARSDDRIARAAGFAHLQTGDDARAILFLDASARSNPSQPDVHAALGDIYRRQGDRDTCLKHLRKAAKLAPNEPELHYKLGLASLSFMLLDEAASQMKAALALTPELLKARLGLARALTEQGRFAEAEAELILAGNTAPEHYAVAFRLAKLREKQGRSKDAITLYRQAESWSEHSAPVCEALGLVELASGDANTALATFHRGLGKTPRHVELLKHSAELRYEMGDVDAFSWYAEALKTGPDRRIHGDYILNLINADKIEEALDQLRAYETQYGRGTDWMKLTATMHYSQGAYQAILDTLLKAPAEDAALARWKAQALLGCGEARAAQKIITWLNKHDPFDQHLLALLGTCYRITNKQSYDELVNYEHLLIQAELPVPQGYSSLPAFNSALRETLEELHITRSNPLSQSVKGGTQTPGNLFLQPHPVIGDLKKAIQATLAREFNAALFKRLAEGHPVNVARGKSFSLQAAWSIRVTQGGYHRPHVHPKGWYSSAYYVSLPSEMKDADPAGNQGSLAFGRPGISVPGAMDAERLVSPKEGLLALFPSYFWHETLPFNSDEPRVVVAFDTLPGK